MYPSTENNWSSNEQRHPTRALALKLIEVDEEIVPLVRWINDFMDTFTLWSCQGDSDEEQAQGPYVMFMCRDSESISKIKVAVYECSTKLSPGEHISLESRIEYEGDAVNTVYSLNLSGKAVLKKMIEVTSPRL